MCEYRHVLAAVDGQELGSRYARRKCLAVVLESNKRILDAVDNQRLRRDLLERVVSCSCDFHVVESALEARFYAFKTHGSQLLQKRPYLAVLNGALEQFRIGDGPLESLFEALVRLLSHTSDQRRPARKRAYHVKRQRQTRFDLATRRRDKNKSTTAIGVPQRKVNRARPAARYGDDGSRGDAERIEETRIRVSLLLRRLSNGHRSSEITRPRDRQKSKACVADSARQ